MKNEILLKFINFFIILLLANGCIHLQKRGISSNKQIEALEKEKSVIFTSETRSLLMAKYEKEAKGSDFYWKELSGCLEEFKKIHPQKETITSSDIGEFLSSKSYGTLILRSNPTGATIDFEAYLGIQGTTTYTIILPPKSYRIKLTRRGCNSKEITVSIVSNSTTDTTVTLEESESKIIEHRLNLRQMDKENFKPKGS